MKQVYNVIEDSIYYTDRKGLRFYFSSEFNKQRFLNSLEEYIKNENRKLTNRYKVSIDLVQYMALSLYKKIEKRGFRVYHIKDEYYLHEQIQFNTNL